MRQTAVFETEYEPALKPKILHEIIEDDVIAGVYLENVGSYPAYSLYVGLIDEIKAKSIDDLANRERGPKALSPGESLLLFSCQLSEYRSMHIKMNVVYVNILKKVGEIHFVKFPETEEFGMYVVSQRHGILLRSLEDLKLACSAIKWSRTVKRNG